MGKTKSKKHAEAKKVVRSSYSNRVCNGRDIIIVDEAEEYLKKMGYKVIKPQMRAGIIGLTGVFIMLGAYIIS